MNKLILVGATALFLTACTKSEASTVPPGTPPKPSVPADNAASVAVIELGKDIGKDTVTAVHAALKDVAGVGEIAIKEGSKDFSVHFDALKVKAADLVAKLKAAGEAGAKLKM